MLQYCSGCMWHRSISRTILEQLCCGILPGVFADYVLVGFSTRQGVIQLWLHMQSMTQHILQFSGSEHVRGKLFNVYAHVLHAQLV